MSPTQAPQIAAIDLKHRHGLEDKQLRYNCNSLGRTSATRTQFGRQMTLSQLHWSTRTSIQWSIISQISRAMSRPKGGRLSNLAIGPFVFKVVTVCVPVTEAIQFGPSSRAWGYLCV